MAFKQKPAFRRRFEFGLAWRTAVLLAAIWLFIEAMRMADLRAARMVALFIAFAALASLWAFIRRTNFQVSRFIESVRFEDYAQRFSDPSGGGFDVLGDTLDTALKQLQARHVSASSEARYLSAIVDDSPSALVAIDQDGKVEMLNKSARQLMARLHIARAEDLRELGPELAAAVQLPPGTRKITRLMIEGVPHRAIFASAHVARLEGGVTVLSILPVQSELGALEIAAQATESGVPTITDFMSVGLAKKIKQEHGAASVVCAFNVFAHNDDIAGMTESIRELLAPGGVFVFEASYLLDILDRMLLGTLP